MNVNETADATVKKLMDRVHDASDSTDAMRYSQAAQNVANAALTLAAIKKKDQ